MMPHAKKQFLWQSTHSVPRGNKGKTALQKEKLDPNGKDVTVLLRKKNPSVDSKQGRENML